LSNHRKERIMKIQDSSVQLTASHEESYSRSSEITSTTSFRQIFADLAQPANDEAAEARKRVQRLLQSLLDTILAAIDGKKCKENFAAVEPLPDDPAPGQRPRNQLDASCRPETQRKRADRCLRFGLRTDHRRTTDRLRFLVAPGARRNAPVDLRRQRHHHPARSADAQLRRQGLRAERRTHRLRSRRGWQGRGDPAFGAASGFLVFDRNGNGKADNGSELFGVASGNGFADLRRLDEDRNGWIDENDSAWRQLAVWSGSGFASLAERQVGALYTGAVDAVHAQGRGQRTARPDSCSRPLPHRER
jgi:hypothetical protein